MLKAFTKKVYFLLNTLSLALSLSLSLSLSIYIYIYIFLCRVWFQIIALEKIILGTQISLSQNFTKARSQTCNFIKKETLAQVFSCEFCEFSKNIFSYRTTPMTASEMPSSSCKYEGMIEKKIQPSFLSEISICDKILYLYINEFQII